MVFLEKLMFIFIFTFPQLRLLSNALAVRIQPTIEKAEEQLSESPDVSKSHGFGIHAFLWKYAFTEENLVCCKSSWNELNTFKSLVLQK